MKQFRLPDPGEGLVEAEIVTWRVAVGDEVKVNDIVVEVETSKSLVELPIPFAGTVSELLANVGDIVDVGAPIITVDDGVDPHGKTPTDDLVPELGAGDGQVTGDVQVTSDGQVTGDAQVTGDGQVAADGQVAGDVQVAAGGQVADGEQIEDGKIGGAAPGGRVAILVGYGPRTTEAKRRPRKSGASGVDREPARAQVADTFSTSAPVSRRADERSPLPRRQDTPVGAPLPRPGTSQTEARHHGGAVLAKPPVRKLAKDLGIDLSVVTGTGAGGVITRSDVDNFGPTPGLNAPSAPTSASASTRASDPAPDRVGAADRAPAAASTAAPAASAMPARSDRRIPVQGVRKMTAEAMVASAFTAPHVTEWLTCDVTASMELLERLRSRREFSDVRVSPLLLVAKAVCLALGRSPELNSSWDEAAQEIVLKGAINLGVAAATPRGLLVPNLKNAQSLGLVELAEAITGLVSVAKQGRTPPADTAHGTFTITNVGVFGVDAGTPILNPGEAGILCLGAIDRRPWVVGTGADERIEPRWITTLALSFDHRLVDGERGSKFLADVASILRDPGLALLF